MNNREPLAERLRPKKLDDFVGQKHLIGEGAVLRKLIDSGNLQSIIFWGPPGVGKTTLSQIIAAHMKRKFYTLSAVSSGVKDVRQVIELAKHDNFFNSPSPILFIDEIHRFSKSQQDSLLAAVEQGVFVLVGATTENPSFEVITPLLSRCQVYILKHLENSDLELMLENAIKKDSYLKTLDFILQEKEALFLYAGGDARKFLNIIELLVSSAQDNSILVTNNIIEKLLQQNLSVYDKSGELHYDIISAFIKSIRGSSPDAAIYWLARMLAGGEDVKFIARRMIVSAAEDIGLANPNALLLANSCFEAVHKIGMPEARIILAETTIYLACSAKSNSAYLSIDEALNFVNSNVAYPVPLHLRNAPTKLMKQLDYGKNYKYPHDYSGNYVQQDYLPEEIINKKFYIPQNNSAENKYNTTK